MMARFSCLTGKILTISLSLVLLSGCAGNAYKDGMAPDEPVDVLYTKGADALDRGDFKEAAEHFSEVDRQHPYSPWAAKAQVMEAYAYYKNMNYDDAVSALDQFIELHPGNPQVGYAYYLRGLCNYERILDVRRDQSAALEALRNFDDVVTRFPDSEYAKDAVMKTTLINDHLAGAEMEVGRYYLTRRLYIAAIGRFKSVIDKYQTTSHVPEALERLVETYAALGLMDEAKKNAAVLGHNFPGSEWYQDAYKLLTARGIILETKEKK